MEDCKVGLVDIVIVIEIPILAAWRQGHAGSAGTGFKCIEVILVYIAVAINVCGRVRAAGSAKENLDVFG